MLWWLAFGLNFHAAPLSDLLWFHFTSNWPFSHNSCMFMNWLPFDCVPYLHLKLLIPGLGGEKRWGDRQHGKKHQEPPWQVKETAVLPFKESNQLSSYKYCISLANEVHHQFMISLLAGVSFFLTARCVLLENCLRPELCSQPHWIMKLATRLCVSTCVGRSCLVLWDFSQVNVYPGFIEIFF